MQLVSLIMVRVIASSLMVVCMALTSSIYGLDTRSAAGKSALAIPFELVDSHIFLRISVNGSRPLSFILDTGASHTILSLRNAGSVTLIRMHFCMHSHLLL